MSWRVDCRCVYLYYCGFVFIIWGAVNLNSRIGWEFWDETAFLRYIEQEAKEASNMDYGRQ